MPTSSRNQKSTSSIDKTFASSDKTSPKGTKSLTPQATEDNTVTESEPGSLWDKAYDALRQEHPDTWAAYEGLLSRVLTEAPQNSISDSECEADSSDVRNQIPQHDVTARREKLKHIAELGLNHIEDGRLKSTIFGKEMSLQDTVGNFAHGVDWIQAYARDALKDVPFAPVAMAGISILLVFLRNPAVVDADNQEGLRYVSSQIRFYAEMEPYFLSQSMTDSLKDEIMKSLIDLYKLVINFQVQSVLRFYSSSGKRYIKDVTKYDSWDAQVESIKKTESSLHQNAGKALSGASLRQLEKIQEESRRSRKTLETISNHAQAVEKHMSDAEYRRCLANLKATNPIDDKERIEDDKGGLLEDSYRWVLENDQFKTWRHTSRGLLWIKGDPGKGKTMLLCGIINELPTQGTNIAFFFFQESNQDISNATAVLRGLISMLVKQQPSLQSHVGEGPFEGQNAWFALRKVLIDILKDPVLQETYLVIDALDECTRDQDKLLRFLVEISSNWHVKCLISSRNLPSIEKDLHDAKQTRLILEDESIRLAAVDSFIQHKINALAKRNGYSPELRHRVQDHLVLNANGTFLWVALVCKQLAKIAKRHVLAKLEEYPSGLNDLYKRMLDQIIESEDAEICKTLLGVATAVYRPLTLDEIPSYIQLSEDEANDLEDIIGNCGSFLSLRGHTISLVHQSAKDFFLQMESDMIYPDGVDNVHYNIFSRSLQTMELNLRRDIYSINDPGYPIQGIKRPDPDPLAAIRYGVVHWVEHMDACYSSQILNKDLQDGGSLDRFLQRNYLHWLEALSILESITEGIASILKLESLLQKIGEPQVLLHRVSDAARFFQYNKVAIESSPLQVYSSPLIFSPMQSMTRTCYQAQSPSWILNTPEAEKSWSTCLQTLEGHTRDVTSVVWSPDGSQIASASWDKTVRTWNPVTGHCALTFQGSNGMSSSIAWSQGQLALADDKTIKIWKTGTAQCKLLNGHRYNVTSIAWLQDECKLVSASSDATLRIWDTTTEQCVQVLEGHTAPVISIALSQNQLASGSAGGTVKVWELNTYHCISTFEGYNKHPGSLVWSPDGSRLASAAMDHKVTIWNSTSQCNLMLQKHTDSVRSLAWSKDGSRLASASRDKTINIWDTNTGQNVFTLDGHNDIVNSVSWSSDGNRLASGALYGKLIIWDTISGQELSTFEGHTGTIESLAWSPNGSRLASGASDHTVRIWDTSTNLHAQMVERGRKIHSICWSPEGSRLATAFSNKTVKIWDPETSQCISTLEVDSGLAVSVAWSQDGNRLASACFGDIVNIWDLTTEKCISMPQDESFDVLGLYGFKLDQLLGIIMPSAFAKPSPKEHGYGLNNDMSWIAHDGVNILWLPPEYRPASHELFAMSASTAAIGCSSGRIIFLKFSNTHMPLGHCHRALVQNEQASETGLTLL
ncbi:uncharacterized protein N7511_004092 [Penicillium nucicola]|uniref:uncharacterized protein n=1 Tax=Penicillium nucicola TaxID=1850975 RepID=UPI002545B77D|nr:uncharacterized protein N7511_004092 [Penicillium nucicola]KAJ5766476.1 hypothetical protein N7511_004092 [Penicillium nucicola]